MKRRKNQGITLIALVITIIVLLILAGVSIATLTGENGILSKADTAKKQSEIADATEQAKLDISAYIAEQIEQGKSTELNDSIIQEILTGKDYVNGQPGENSFQTKKKKYEIFYSDLYTPNLQGKISFTLTHDNPEFSGSFEVESGTTWNDFMSEKFPNNVYRMVLEN